jgi:transcriptional regulator with XRE-family HTH domain
MDDETFRRQLGEALRLARELRGEPVHRAQASGVGYKVIGRLERGENESVELSAIYLLAHYYRIDLRRLVDAGADPDAESLGRWRSLPSLPEVDAYMRREFRRRRKAKRIGAKRVGTPAVAQAADVHQSWLALWEGGRIARCDLVRIRRCAEAIGCSLSDLIPSSRRAVQPTAEASP